MRHGPRPRGLLGALAARVLSALGAAACAAAVAAGVPADPPQDAATRPDQTSTIAFRIASQDRRAVVFNAPTDGTLRPAVLVLHGGMGSAELMRASSGFDALARKHGFMAVYPEGTEFGDGRHAWNTGHLLRRQVRDADDIAYLDGLIDRLIAEHGADPTRIFMTGGSNGGMMTFVYAVARPERLAAIAPVVASMFSFEQTPKVPLPILMINGAKDQEVPLAGGMSGNALVRAAQSTPYKPVREVVDFWVRANKSKREGTTSVEGTVTTTTYAAEDGGATTEFVVDSTGGHGWPGTRTRRNENMPIMAFRGAERVWAFFADKARVKSDKALLEVEVLEFPALVDEDRRSARDGAEPKGRRVPIKLHVPKAGGPHPVVVVSHGAGGDWDTHSGQAQELATHGYAVLCVEHVGSNRARLRQEGLRMLQTIEAMTRDADEVLGRPKDISFAIDRATEWNASHPTLKGRLDTARTGVLGHSFGAYTTMAVCGMRPALDWLAPRQEPGKGLGPDLRDPRVRCGVALSPQGPGEPFFLAESFGGLRAPLLGISGTRDNQQAGRAAAERKAAFSRWAEGAHRFVWLTNAGHNDFTSSSGATGLSLPSATREDVQPVVRAATLAFLDLHLRGDAKAADRLTAEALKPLLQGKIDAVEVLAK